TLFRSEAASDEDATAGDRRGRHGALWFQCYTPAGETGGVVFEQGRTLSLPRGSEALIIARHKFLSFLLLVDTCSSPQNCSHNWTNPLGFRSNFTVDSSSWWSHVTGWLTVAELSATA